MALLLLSATATVRAAAFVSTPAAANAPGARSYDFTAASSGGDGENGWLAYKLPTEVGWHRCQHPNPVSFSMTNLPDGTYTVLIADDINIDYWAARGQIYSGHTAGCGTTDMPATSTSPFQFTVGPAESLPPDPPPPTAPQVPPQDSIPAPTPTPTSTPTQPPVPRAPFLSSSLAAIRAKSYTKNHYKARKPTAACRRVDAHHMVCRLAWRNKKGRKVTRSVDVFKDPGDIYTIQPR